MPSSTTAAFRCCWPRLPPVAGKDPAQVEEALLLLDKVYEGHLWHPFFRSGDSSAAQRFTKEKLGSDMAAVYGELSPFSLVAMLNCMSAEAGQRFYDLGCGTGKAVLLAGLLGLSATGIEIIKERYDTACAALENLKAQVKHGCEEIRLLHADVLEVDFCDADIVYSHNLTWPPDVLQKVAQMAAGLRKGSLVASSKSLEGPGLKEATQLSLITNYDSDATMRVFVAIGASDKLKP